MKFVYRSLLALHLFVGVGALSGGMAAILNPYNPLGVPLEALKNSPFSNYLIPGIILFLVIGIGNILGALFILLKSRLQGYISGVISMGLVIWIVVQCIMLQEIVFLHILFFSIGILKGLLSLILLFNEQRFPANLISRIIEK